MTYYEGQGKPVGGVIVGIDPGKSGGIAIIDAITGELLRGHRMPLIKHGNRDLVDTRQIAGFVGEMRRISAIVIEQVGAMPGQGVTSMFNFGRHTGAVEGWALGRGAPVIWVRPAKWKGHFNLSSDKRASLDRARLEFGDDKIWDVLANDGIAEAALIATWYVRQGGRVDG